MKDSEKRLRDGLTALVAELEQDYLTTNSDTVMAYSDSIKRKLLTLLGRPTA